MAPRPIPRLFAPLIGSLLAALAPAARADLLVGHVQDPAGVGVPAVNIDVQDMFTGDDLVVFNDSTDANGDFAIDLPPGLYRLIFFPPPPPVTTLLTGVVENVAVVGFTDMGTTVLEGGVALGARVISSMGLPLPDVNLDLIDLASGQELPLPGDLTDIAGIFLVAVPRRPIDLRLNPANAPGGPHAPHSIELDLAADTDLGDLPLAPGWIVSMNLVGPGGGVKDADLDVLDPVTGKELYTPGDNSDSNGFVDVVLAAGTYDIEICPQFDDRLVARTLFGVGIDADVHLGNVFLQPGIVLAGHVDDPVGVSVANVDLNAFKVSTGEKITTCADNTDGAGDYAIVIPTGSFQVVFTPPYVERLASLSMPLSVNGDTTLNATLPPCPGAQLVGWGRPGSGGLVPEIRESGGSLRLGNPGWTLLLSRGLGGAQAVITVEAVTTGTLPPPPGGLGAYRPRRFFHVFAVQLGGAFGVPGAGSFSQVAPLPKDPVLAGVTLRARVFVRDPGAAGGVAISRILKGEFCD